MSRPKRRWLYAAAAAAAGAVVVLFSTVGDGVEVPGATGAVRLIIDAGHQTVWGLLALAFAAAAIRGRWGRVAQVLAVSAGVAYLAFLAAVFLG